MNYHLLLGSNIAPERYMLDAIRALELRFRGARVSSFYRSEAVGRPEQDDYVNAAVSFSYGMDPTALKWTILRPMEASLGRQREKDRYAARTIDIDIVLAGDDVLDLDGSPIPDPDLLKRPHVVWPVAELSPFLRHPLVPQTMMAIAEEIGHKPKVVRL